MDWVRQGCAVPTQGQGYFRLLPITIASHIAILLLVQFKVWRDLRNVIVKLRVFGLSQVLSLNLVHGLFVPQVWRALSGDLATSLILILLLLIIVAYVHGAVVQPGCIDGPLALLEAARSRSVVWALIFRWIEDPSDTALDHLIPRYLLRIDINRIIRWIRWLMTALIRATRSTFRWKHQVVLFDFGIWMLLWDRIVRDHIILSVFGAA